MRVCALTTVDNPFDPIDDFEQWFVWDVTRGHNSCAYLARIARTSDGLSDAQNEQEIERAIDEIVALDFMNEYKKVTRDLPGGGSQN